MYKKFFGLKESPFNVNPDPRYLFLTRHTEEALACLTYGIQSRKGFVLLTGEVDELIELQVKIAEITAHDVPVRLLTLQVEFDQIDQHPL